MNFDARAKSAFIVACVVLLASGLGFRLAVQQLNVYLQKKPVELRDTLTNVPLQLGHWKAIGKDQRVDEATLETLGTELYLTRNYQHQHQQATVVSLHVTYYTGLIDAVPHVPDRCMLAAGFEIEVFPDNYALTLDTSEWYEDTGPPNVATSTPYMMARPVHPVTARVRSVRMPVGDLTFRVTEFSHPNLPDTTVFAGYTFVANGRSAGTPEEVRLFAFDLTDEYAYYCKIQLSMRLGRDATADEFLVHVEDFLSTALPELMLCLPDWADVEQLTAPAAAGP